MRVLKFGGTSIADAEHFLHVANILESNITHGQVATVLSAPAKITNYLASMIKTTIDRKNVLPGIKNTQHVFTELLNELAQTQSNFPLKQLILFVKQEFTQIKRILHNVSLLGRCPDNINASLICRGEKLSIAIMAALLKVRGHNITVIDPVKKLLALGHYLESIVDINESTRRILASKIPSDHMILMAGFTAGNEKGEIVVLGRNSSDYSAAILAACLQADCCEIWTDVNGIYTCDPNKVPEARLLKSISYREAVELTCLGAKILHPRAIFLIAQLQIPCFIKNISNPTFPGTLISAHSDEDMLSVKGISNLNNMVMFSISGSGINGTLGITARIFATISRNGIFMILVIQSSHTYKVSFCVHQDDCLRTRRVLEEEFYYEFEEGLLDPIVVKDQLAIISVISNGLYNTSNEISAKFFTALAMANINIIAVAKRYSEWSISVVIDKNHVTTGVQIIHQMLI